MKRKIIAFMLVLLMLCPLMLAGCGGGKEPAETDVEGVGKTTVRDTVTLTMWVVTDEKTTPEAQEAVEKAINVITKSTYTTAIDMIFYTKEEYDAALDAKFDAVDESIANGTPAKPKDVVTGEQYFVNELGVNELKYPDVYENQVDIVFIAGRDRLNSLVEAGRLMKLNDSLSSTGAAKILNDVIPQQFFTHTMLGLSGKDSYAVPNNRVVGDYTYLLINKELVTGDANGDGTVSGDEIKGTYLNFSDIVNDIDKGSFSDWKTFEEIVEYAKVNKTDMIPLLSKFENPYVKYWSEDGSFSVIASKVLRPDLSYEDNSFEQQLQLGNVFANTSYTNFELLMKKYELENYLADDVEAAKAAKNFGVGVIKGDNSVIEQYSDNYYIKVIENPELNDDNLFTSFYGITNYTINFDRALEIIVCLNTNSEFRNTLQYGVEGTHYEINEHGRVERFNDDYIMDITTTGNVFIAYPEEDMADDVWERGVASNLDIQVDPMTGFWKVESKISDDLYKQLADFSQTCKEAIDACQTVEELDSCFKTLRADVNKSSVFSQARASSVPSSIYYVYNEWFLENWPVPES